MIEVEMEDPKDNHLRELAHV